MELCLVRISSRSKYDAMQPRLCQMVKDHTGAHREFPFLIELDKSDPRVSAKIARDSTMTTGASWKSADAGPNRIQRWVMLLPDEELLKFGINMQDLKPQVISKLRDKAARYETCIEVAKKLTWLVYQMPDAPKPSVGLINYLEVHFGKMEVDSSTCMVCKAPLSFKLFAEAVRGKAAIETSHSNPRLHNPDNVGFAHRECNIAQSGMNLEQFYTWIEGILSRVRGD